MTGRPIAVLHVLPSLDDDFGGPGPLVASVLETAARHRPDEAAGSVVLGVAGARGEVVARIEAVARAGVYRPGAVLGRLHASARLLREVWVASAQAQTVVAHSVFNLAALFAAFSARARGARLVVAPHASLNPYDVGKHARAKRLLGPVWRWLIDGTDLWCMAELEVRQAVTFGAVPSFHVAPPSIRTQLPVPRARADQILHEAGLELAGCRERGGRVVTFIGRFDVKKGIPRTVAAFDRAAGDHDVLVLAGSGDESYTEVVDRAVAAARRRDRIAVPGWLDESQKRALLARSDVFVLASDDENFGMAVAEAMAAGVPVVVSDQVALADLVERHAAGLVCTRDVERIADGLRTLLEDDQLRRTAGRWARKAVESELSDEACLRRYLDLMHPHGRPSPADGRSNHPGAFPAPGDDRGVDMTEHSNHLAVLRARSTTRRVANRLGLELSLNPFSHRLVSVTRERGVSTVLDIGANEGQYARGLRAAGFAGRIVSVEPLGDAYDRLRSRAARDQCWDTLRLAISDSCGTVTINVAANSVSSSVLPMLPSHEQADPYSRYVNRETVRSVTIDELVRQQHIEPERTLLKIDVQGFESAVLDGARETLSRFAVLQVELSLVPLYDGQSLMYETVDRMRSLGYDLWVIESGFSDPDSGRLLQCDGVFVREAA